MPSEPNLVFFADSPFSLSETLFQHALTLFLILKLATLCSLDAFHQQNLKRSVPLRLSVWVEPELLLELRRPESVVVCPLWKTALWVRNERLRELKRLAPRSECLRWATRKLEPLHRAKRCLQQRRAARKPLQGLMHIQRRTPRQEGLTLE